jgi:hypothetical protein
MPHIRITALCAFVILLRSIVALLLGYGGMSTWSTRFVIERALRASGYAMRTFSYLCCICKFNSLIKYRT